MWRGSVVAMVAALAAVSGCGDEPLPKAIESFCFGVCAGAVGCDGRISRQACETNCILAPENSSLDSIRPEAAAIIGDCLAHEDCTTIFDGPFDACWERAHENTPPSARLRAFCPDYAASAFECGYWYSVEECQDSLDIWTDRLLDRLTSCTQEATCASEDACIKAAFGVP